VAIVDIETAPNLAYVWGHYEQNVIAYERQWTLLSFAYKWRGEKKVHCSALCDFPSYERSPHDDSQLMAALWRVFDEADLIVWHNGDRFDRKKSNTRFLAANLSPPSPYKTVDTLKVARREFAFNSNKLGDLAKFFGFAGKVKHDGAETWLGCIRGDAKQWALMKKYNAHDVVINEWVYERLLPWITNHPNITLDEPKRESPLCPNCGSDRVLKRGWNMAKSYRMRRYQCLGCGHWSSGEREKIAGQILS
jgi:hypothetical protein